MSLEQGPQAPTPPTSNFAYEAQEKGLGIVYDQAVMKVERIEDLTVPEKLGTKGKEKDFKVSILKITPTAPGKTPFVCICCHAASGGEPKDQEQRELEWVELNKLALEALEKHKDCNSVVVGGDLNVSAFIGKDVDPSVLGPDKKTPLGLTTEKVDARKDGSQYKINPTTKALIQKAGKGLSFKKAAVAQFIIKKKRVKGNLWLNQQAKKGGLVDEDSKSGLVLFERAGATPQTEEDLDKLLDGIQVPTGPKSVRVFGPDDTEGSDHAPTGILEVEGIQMEARPLIQTSPEVRGGYSDPTKVYMKNLESTDLDLMEKTSDALMKLLKDAITTEHDKLPAESRKPLLEVNKGKSEDFIESDDFIEKNKSLLLVFDKFVEADSSENVLSEASKTLLTEILTKWITSENYKNVNKLLVDPQIKGVEDIPKIIKAIQTKGKNIPDTIAEQFKSAQVSAGYPVMPGEGPRAAQLTALEKGPHMTIVTESGEKAHQNLAADMEKVVKARSGGKDQTYKVVVKAPSALKKPKIEKLKEQAGSDSPPPPPAPTPGAPLPEAAVGGPGGPLVPPGSLAPPIPLRSTQTTTTTSTTAQTSAAAAVAGAERRFVNLAAREPAQPQPPLPMTEDRKKRIREVVESTFPVDKFPKDKISAELSYYTTRIDGDEIATQLFLEGEKTGQQDKPFSDWSAGIASNVAPSSAEESVVRGVMAEVLKEHSKKLTQSVESPRPGIFSGSTSSSSSTGETLGTSRSTDATNQLLAQTHLLARGDQLLGAASSEGSNLPAKKPFSRASVIGFAVAGALIGAAISIAIIGLAWPVIIAAAATALVVGGLAAIYQKSQATPPAVRQESEGSSPAAVPPPAEAGTGPAPALQPRVTVTPSTPGGADKATVKKDTDNSNRPTR